jgi:hypothetical protein
MAEQISLRCRCGDVRGIVTDVSPKSGIRVICYCDDCQAFAHFLKRPDVLDAAGGTDIFQMAPAKLMITHGTDALRCLRLTPRGMQRFYTGCCNTPIGNTMNANIPFVGVVHSFMDHADSGRTRDALLGPPVAWILARFATGPLPPKAHPKAPISLILRTVRHLLLWKLTRQGRPSPFFDDRGQARVSPYVLSDAERASLRSGSAANATLTA